MPAKSQPLWTLRASGIDRFRAVAKAPDQETKNPVRPETAKRLVYHTWEVDSLPHSHTASFGRVGNPTIRRG